MLIILRQLTYHILLSCSDHGGGRRCTSRTNFIRSRDKHVLTFCDFTLKQKSYTDKTCTLYTVKKQSLKNCPSPARSFKL